MLHRHTFNFRSRTFQFCNQFQAESAGSHRKTQGFDKAAADQTKITVNVIKPDPEKNPADPTVKNSGKNPEQRIPAMLNRSVDTVILRGESRKPTEVSRVILPIAVGIENPFL